ncbi:MAG: hypothetical protein NT105_11455 [Verrucomicrobia bacterium]|nr:hypothetical protein [Verrucomicrobiota bacterium]
MNQIPDECRRLEKAVNIYNRHKVLVTSTTRILNYDLGFAKEQWQQHPTSQFWRRTVVRCTCAFVEGLLGLLKRFSQQTAEYFDVELSKEDIEVITESRECVENGLTRTKPAYMQFRDNVKKTFAVYAKAHGIFFNIDYGCSGYKDLLDTFELRHRLMHPKDQSDLEVNDKAMGKVVQGGDWFHRTLDDVLQKCEARMPWASQE